MTGIHTWIGKEGENFISISENRKAFLNAESLSPSLGISVFFLH